jgi:hypothetical protein
VVLLLLEYLGLLLTLLEHLVSLEHLEHLHYLEHLLHLPEHLYLLPPLVLQYYLGLLSQLPELLEPLLNPVVQ